MANQKRMIVTIVTEYEQAGEPRRKYTDVGSAFIGEHKGKTYVNINLDFPVGVTKLTLFEPKQRNDEQN